MALHRCLLRCTVGSTGAEEMASAHLTCSLVIRTVIVPVLHFSCHRCIRCNCDLLTWPPCALSNAPVLLRGFIRCLPVRPEHWRRLNRCYCFCIHLSKSSLRSFGHFKIYSISAFSLRLVISVVDWTHLYGELDILEMVWTSSMEPKNPINVISQIC